MSRRSKKLFRGGWCKCPHCSKGWYGTWDAGCPFRVCIYCGKEHEVRVSEEERGLRRKKQRRVVTVKLKR